MSFNSQYPARHLQKPWRQRNPLSTFGSATTLTRSLRDVTAATPESEVLSGLVPELEAEGYEVFLHPGPPLAPSFLGSVRPDAIAIRGDKKLLIEIVRAGGRAEKRLDFVERLVSDHPEWELRVILVSPTNTPE